VAIGGIILQLFPDFLRSLVFIGFFFLPFAQINLERLMANVVTNVPRNNKRAHELLGPMIEERFRMMKEYGDSWEDKPNDFLQWMIEDAGDQGRSVREHVQYILVINFAAIHTSSIVCT
jgi:hypothetical protein